MFGLRHFGNIYGNRHVGGLFFNFRPLNDDMSVWPSGYGRRLSYERVWVQLPEQASWTQATILPRSVK